MTKQYSVCRGFEIPFEQTPQGLQWALEKSSMVGTTIGHHPDGADFIVIRDAQSENFTSESEYPHDTGPRPMTRIGKPSWLLDPTTSPPKSNDDCIGTYQPAWFPYFRIEIYKEGKKYCERYYELDQERNWTLQRESLELSLPEEGLGFGYFYRNKENVFFYYNEFLRRFEMVKQDTIPEIRMPLVRIPTGLENDYTLPFAAIGIPSWH